MGFISILFPFILPLYVIRVEADTGEPLRGPDGLAIECQPGEPGEMVGRIDKGHPVRDFHGYSDKSSTNKKINESLKETYATWGKDSERLQVPRDPQSWSKEHVGHWLSWAIREFNLTGLTGQFEQFRVSVSRI